MPKKPPPPNTPSTFPPSPIIIFRGDNINGIPPPFFFFQIENFDCQSVLLPPFLCRPASLGNGIPLAEHESALFKAPFFFFVRGYITLGEPSPQTSSRLPSRRGGPVALRQKLLA